MIGLVVAVLTSSSPRARERPFTLVVMPDVQYYTDLRHKLFRLYWDPPTDNLTHIYTQQLQWVVSTRHRLNTRAVIFMVAHALTHHAHAHALAHLAPPIPLAQGDLTQADAPEEWAALRTGLRYLEAARPPVPYCLLQGDHDLGYEYTGEYPFMFRKAAHRRSQVDGGVASAVTAQPHWRGAFASAHQVSSSWASSWANSWYELTTNSSLAPMLVLCLECRPRRRCQSRRASSAAPRRAASRSFRAARPRQAPRAP